MEKSGNGTQEAHWLAGCIKGDRSAQREAFDALLPILRGVIRRYTRSEADVQDIIQESFIRIFKNMNQFDARKGAFTSWSTRVAINTAINEGKKRARHPNTNHEVHVPVDPDAIQNMALEDLINTLKGMPEEQHLVLNLHLVDGFSHKEIGDMIGITSEVSRQRLSRARKWVRDRFDLAGNELVSKTQQER